MRTHMRIILSFGALALLAAPAHADRGRNPLAGQPAIRHRVEMRKMRLEITPQFTISANQPFLIGFGGGANIRFHLTDWLAIGGSYHYTANVASPLVGRISEALPDTYAVRTSTPATDDPTAGLRQPSKDIFKDHLIGPTLGMWSAHLALTPMGGKFSLFNALFANYDFYGTVGIGGVILGTPLSSGATSYTVRTDSAGGMSSRAVNETALSAGNDVNLQSSTPFVGHRIAGVFGIGTHIFFNDFIGLNLELRDYMYKANPGGLDVKTTDSNSDGSGVLSEQDEYLVNHLYFGVGLTIMIPPSAKLSR